MIGITGSSGTLGKILIRKLRKFKINYSEFKGDILNENSVNLWIRSHNFESIFHFAAIVPVDKVEQNKNKTFKVNILGTQNILNALMHSSQIPWIFYASTSHVYDYSKKSITEKSKINPINYYGYTKHLGEKVFSYYVEHINPNVCIGRIFSFYHRSQKVPFLYPSLKRKIKNKRGNSLEIYGSKNIRDISKAEDIVDSIYKIYLKQSAGIINIGSGKGISVKKFAKNILEDNKINIVDKNKYVPNKLVADITKLKKILK